MRLLPATLCLAAACASAPAPVAKAPAPPPPPVALAPPPPARAARIDLLVAGARTLRAAGDAEGAREVLEAALVLAPASDPARLELAGQLVADGRDLDRAARLVSEARPAGSARARVLEGELAELRGDDPGAVEAYAGALEVSPDPDVRLRKALVLERLGRADEALRELHQASLERPGDPVVRARLAERYEAAGLYAAAEEQLKAAAESAPDRPAEWDRLARFYARVGKPDRARAAEARARVASGTAPARKLRPLPRSSR